SPCSTLAISRTIPYSIPMTMPGRRIHFGSRLESVMSLLDGTRLCCPCPVARRLRSPSNPNMPMARKVFLMPESQSPLTLASSLMWSWFRLT
ncbi:hypothetical protein BGZ65_009966, partial [Modicella reniformis]